MPRGSELQFQYKDENEHMSHSASALMDAASKIAINLRQPVVSAEHILFACVLSLEVRVQLLRSQGRELHDHEQLDEYTRWVSENLKVGRVPVVKAFFGAESARVVSDSKQYAHILHADTKNIEPWDLYVAAVNRVHSKRYNLKKSA